MSTDKVDAREAWIAEAEQLLVLLLRDMDTARKSIADRTDQRNANDSYEKLMAHLRTQPEGYQLLRNSTHEERSFPEDATHENGSYYNKCHVCLRQFTGHKRRITCKVCMIAAAQEGE